MGDGRMCPDAVMCENIWEKEIGVVDKVTENN